MNISVNLIEKDEKWIIEIEGDLDIYSSQKFKEKISRVYEEEPKDILIDAKELKYIDSTGLGSLISLLKLTKEAEKKIQIKNLKKNLYKIFSITKLDELFEIEVQ